MKPVLYVAHPLGTGQARWENLERVTRWMAWLINQYPDKAFCCPWLAYARAMGDTPADHKRGLEDDLCILDKCDGIVLVGGAMSPGMSVELNTFLAKKSGTVMNLTGLGTEPPV